ncbi:metalloregulator ArsR/SmtB family transcription factor [Corynebacterium sp. ES2794-CONJ1]|uniref:ArsR/SmtB family transcription factor n=1 Tax=unclassified Corynebacterium TaxID=2624378 RepID=UPI0021677C4A|nr:MULTISPECIES: metalloregulator ArsR/SmtB family transcription factor [unclassified Corynebacterium]MCS4489706.1 metalloregulator ArsR/SmtB family transcription factor [Corynebacterium sp. ES2775-CONJ]MCS4491285.1 metalloregulator ArsR/SmtB family transcription factor [Corynebacterium sp. ES2715-CONJ3]MCS4531618.1 metalloregulator ArsR/SmtB family transcription factor [Corynebacterium sp. ES2730-CONJ]MCU9519014.1 metalloregulator ArsR/SmtB family transcription factor [Corynebacterium sp. ES27
MSRPESARRAPLRIPNAELTHSTAEIFKVLSDPTRLKILLIVASNAGQEICAHHLTGVLGVSAPTITHHMKKLMAASLVTRTKKGKWAYYELAHNAHSARLMPFIGDYF